MDGLLSNAFLYTRAFQVIYRSLVGSQNVNVERTLINLLETTGNVSGGIPS